MRWTWWGELRTAAIVSKLATGLSEKAAAHDLLAAATADSAAALGRPDLGRIAPGATADLVVFDLSGAHLQPVSDPVKTLIWHANPGDVAAVMVNGTVVVQDGRHLLVDEDAIVEAGAASVRKVWAEGLQRGSDRARGDPLTRPCPGRSRRAGGRSAQTVLALGLGRGQTADAGEGTARIGHRDRDQDLVGARRVGQAHLHAVEMAADIGCVLVAERDVDRAARARRAS